MLYRGIQEIKGALRQTFILDVIKYIRQIQGLLNWRAKGKPVPPPHLVKQRIVKGYARKFRIRTFVETGTFLGDMVNATKGTFSRIYSIELDGALYEQARERFSKFDHISIVQGDSGEVLPDILADIKEPCLFWLDAHYSGGITARADFETPIVQELRCILEHPVANHVILIDDTRFFVGQSNYPTMEELRNLIVQGRPDWVFDVQNDIIRIHKPFKV